MCGTSPKRSISPGGRAGIRSKKPCAAARQTAVDTHGYGLGRWNCSGKHLCLRIHLVLPQVDSPLRRSRAGSLTSDSAWTSTRDGDGAPAPQ